MNEFQRRKLKSQNERVAPNYNAQVHQFYWYRRDKREEDRRIMIDDDDAIVKVVQDVLNGPAMMIINTHPDYPWKEDFVLAGMKYLVISMRFNKHRFQGVPVVRAIFNQPV